MTKEAFIEKHRHEIAGWVMDAYTSGRTGAAAAMAMRNTMRMIDQRLSDIWLEFQVVEPAPPANGVAKPTPQGVKR